MPTYERRIGRRVASQPVEVSWRVPEGSRGRWRRGHGRQTAALLDLSVSGLKVRAPAADDLSVGATVPIEIDGVVGRVTIRRIIPVLGSRFADYGLQITPTSHALEEWAKARLAQGDVIDEATWRALLDSRTR